MNNKATGDLGEDLAVTFLKGKGYEIIGRNIREKLGEIDILAKKDDVLVFVEVKSINDSGLGELQVNPEDNLTPDKKRKFIKAVELYNMRNQYEEEFRLDLVTVKIRQNPEITHFEGI